jgi:hypothetical protein
MASDGSNGVNNINRRRSSTGILIGLLLVGILIGLLLFLPSEIVSAGFQGGCSQPADMVSVLDNSAAPVDETLPAGEVNGDGIAGLISSFRQAVGSEPLACQSSSQALTFEGGHCNQFCDPDNPMCDPGLSCVMEPDGYYVCFGGTDATGEVCGGPTPTPTSVVSTSIPPLGAHCSEFCDPTNPVCDAGLSCVMEPDGYYVCWGGTDATGEVCGDVSISETLHCGQVCDPSKPSCDPGLSCLKGITDVYVCWNGTDATGQTCFNVTPQPQPGGSDNPVCACNGPDYICKNADGSIASASYNSAQCGGSGQCGCIPGTFTLACPDGTYAENNPQCLPGGSTCSCVCDQKDANGKCIKGHNSCDPQVFCLP